MRKDAPLAVEVPASDKDKPGWVKVGVIAAVGFVVGIAWPRVMGVRLGPSAPGESTAAAAASTSAQAGRAPEAPPASIVAKAPAASAAAAAATAAVPTAAAAAPAASPVTGPPTVTVQRGSVLSCKTSDGATKKAKECGAVPGIDQLVQPRVRKLASCAGAEGKTGKLSLVVSADFAAGRLTYEIGKSSTLANVEAIAPCLKSAFHETSTKSTPHVHPRYTVAYSAIFSPSAANAIDADKVATKKADEVGDSRSERSAKTSDEKSDKSEKAAKPALAAGEAQVAWEVALVRDTPKTGGLVARLPRGSKVKVGAAKDGWFQVKFGEGYAHEGWVYRGAIGR